MYLLGRRIGGRTLGGAGGLCGRPRTAAVAAGIRLKSSWLVEDAYVNGEWISAERGKNGRLDVFDPGNGAKIAELPDMDAHDVKKAIDAADEAFKGWKTTTGKERCAMIRKVFQMHMDNLDELAELLSMECGKPIAESKGEILYGAGYFEWFAEEAKRSYGETIPEPIPGRKIMTFREPIGPVALLTPFNFPNAMIARKLAAALAAGCTAVIKPSEDTPLSTLAIAKMCEKAGIPKGVVNVVTSSRSADVGSTLTGDERIRGISFTGSTRVGQILMKDSVDSIKRCSMELGGNAPFIVFDDADVEKAVAGLLAAKCRGNGQTCVSPNRLFVQNGIYDDFTKLAAEKFASIKVGHYTEPDVNVGPLINQKAADKINHLLEDALAKGATVLAGGEQLKEKGPFYFQPTLLGNCNSSMLIAKEEIFGPIAPIFKFETEEEAIREANATEAGLASYFFSENVSRTFRVASALESGMVGANTGVISTEVAPFGGVKYSGLGREGSTHGLDDYTDLKSLTLHFD